MSHGYWKHNGPGLNQDVLTRTMLAYHLAFTDSALAVYPWSCMVSWCPAVGYTAEIETSAALLATVAQDLTVFTFILSAQHSFFFLRMFIS